MEYFAGIFDADGWVSIISTGNFMIGLEKTNEKIINLFQEQFGGSIYRKKRNERKVTYTWSLPTDRDKAINFIDKINKFTHIKTNQLNKLKEYLNQSRENRRDSRQEYITTVSNLKKPISYTREQIKVPTTIIPTEEFFKWLAGFMDGDGNFTVFEYQNGIRRSFDSWIGAFNTFGEPIIYIKERLEGSISQYKGIKFPIWKWVCSQKTSQLVCDSLYPLLINRKEQCRLVGEYLKIHATKIRGVDYPDHTVAAIRDIIKQIKYHNSL